MHLVLPKIHEADSGLAKHTRAHAPWSMGAARLVKQLNEKMQLCQYVIQIFWGGNYYFPVLNANVIATQSRI